MLKKFFYFFIFFILVSYNIKIFSNPIYWTNDIRVTNSSGLKKSPAITKMTSTYIDWIDYRNIANGEVYYNINPDTDGIIWNNEAKKTNVPGYYFGVLDRESRTYNLDDTIDSFYGAHVVWFDTRYGTYNKDEVLYKKNIGNNIDTWSRTITLSSNDGYLSINPAIVAYKNGVFCVWEDYKNGNGDLYLKKVTTYDTLASDLSAWSSEIPITPAMTPSNSKKPSIDVDTDNVYIVWTDDRDGNNEIYFSKRNILVDSWSIALRLTNNAGNSDTSKIVINNKI